jgi:hypothetical protein
VAADVVGLGALVDVEAARAVGLGQPVACGGKQGPSSNPAMV